MNALNRNFGACLFLSVLPPFVVLFVDATAPDLLIRLNDTFRDAGRMYSSMFPGISDAMGLALYLSPVLAVLLIVTSFKPFYDRFHAMPWLKVLKLMLQAAFLLFIMKFILFDNTDIIGNRKVGFFGKTFTLLVLHYVLMSFIAFLLYAASFIWLFCFPLFNCIKRINSTRDKY